MKRVIILFAFICLHHFVSFGQKKYEMVIEKTDGSTIVIKTSDIIKTYFREITSGNDDNQGGNNNNQGGDNNNQIDKALVGVWHCVVYESRSSYTIGWKFDANGNCYYDEWGNSRNEGEWDIPGKWNASNNLLTITWTDEEGTDIEKYTYTLEDNGNKMILRREGKNKTYEFIKQ